MLSQKYKKKEDQSFTQAMKLCVSFKRMLENNLKIKSTR